MLDSRSWGPGLDTPAVEVGPWVLTKKTSIPLWILYKHPLIFWVDSQFHKERLSVMGIDWGLLALPHGWLVRLLLRLKVGWLDSEPRLLNITTIGSSHSHWLFYVPGVTSKAQGVLSEKPLWIALFWKYTQKNQCGLVRDLNPGPLAP